MIIYDKINCCKMSSGTLSELKDYLLSVADGDSDDEYEANVKDIKAIETEEEMSIYLKDFDYELID